MGIREYTNWENRSSDYLNQVEPYKKYYILCEGINTEQFYFKRLIDDRKELGIKRSIELILLEKDEDENGTSYPMHLIKKADEIIENGTIDYNSDLDVLIIVFDADIFEYKSNQYDIIVNAGEKKGYVLAVTNPRFELFLLLHCENSYITKILPNKDAILRKENLVRNGLIDRLLHEETGINAKTNPRIGELADNVKIAIEQEKCINQDIHNCKRNITSNIGQTIEKIINDRGELVL